MIHRGLPQAGAQGFRLGAFLGGRNVHQAIALAIENGRVSRERVLVKSRFADPPKGVVAGGCFVALDFLLDDPSAGKPRQIRSRHSPRERPCVS